MSKKELSVYGILGAFLMCLSVVIVPGNMVVSLLPSVLLAGVGGVLFGMFVFGAVKK